MKKVILSVGLALCAVFSAKAQVPATETSTPSMNPNAPKFKFETEIIDYGTIEYGSDGNRQFKFTNVGKEPLIIQNAQAQCGCTTPDWPKEPIMPGQTAIIKVHYDTKRPGSFEKMITITSNADTPTKVIKIKGFIKDAPAPAAAPAPAPAPPQGTR